MVHTRKERYIVITKPTGNPFSQTTLGSSPANLWLGIFLLHPPFPPEFQVHRSATLMGSDTLPRKNSSEPLKLGNSIASSVTPHDQALKSTLDQGHLSHHIHLTSQDIDLMTSFFGSCTALLWVYRTTLTSILRVYRPHPPVDQCLVFDFQLLTTPSVGDNTQAIIAIDDRSDFLSVLRSKSKDHHDVMIPLEHNCVSLITCVHTALHLN